MSKRLIDRPDRHFQVWAYSVSMRRLLLRSTKSVSSDRENFTTRIDVYFQNVKAMNLPTSMDGLVITHAERGAAVRISDETRLLPDDSTKFFDIECSRRKGFVVASLAVETEDEGEYNEPNRFWPGADSGIAFPIFRSRFRRG